MKKKSVLPILSAAFLLTAGCGAQETPPQQNIPDTAEPTAEAEAPTGETAPTEAAEPTEASEEDAVTTGGTPWINSELKENITADMATSPKDDFHLYANKEWILNNDIPDGYSGWSHYQERGYEVKQQCMDLLKDESIEGHDADLIRTYNSLLLDWDARNEKGVSEIQDLYDKILAAESIDDISALMTEKESSEVAYNLFGFYAGTGLNDPETNIVIIYEPSLLLTDSAEYSERSDYGNMYYGYEKDMFVFLAQKMGMSEADAESCFDTAIDLETVMSEKIYSTEDQLNEDYYDKINNEMSYEDVIALAEVFPLDDVLTSAGYKYNGTYLVTRPDYFEMLDSIYTDEHVEEIKDLFLVNYLLGYTRSLDRETYDKANELRSTYFGVNGTLPDEEMAYNQVTSMLPTSMQKVYIAKYGSEEDKKKMEELCQQVIDTYRELLSENEWASDEVREYAIEKLDHITIHAAYPDKFRDTSKLDLTGCSLIEAETKLAWAELDYNISQIGKKVDHEMWAEGFNILDCNAFYSPTENTINMIIGMMGEPFYSSDMSTEELYASIGAFWVGHEVSHAFDSGGAQFDAEGYFRDWWTEEDKAEFDRRVAKMDDYLDGIVAFGDKHFIGGNIDTEMVADMTGLQCALRMASKVDGFDYDRFFTKYAQMNASLGVYSSELSQLMQDEHPLDYSRTNVPVQQFEEFYETYDVQEGDNMYLAPEDRLIIW